MSDTKDVALNKRIIGLPHCFPNNSDPDYRVFTKTFIENANIVNIVPGVPEFTSGSVGSEKYELLKAMLNSDDKSSSAGLWSDNDYNAPKPNTDYYKDNPDSAAGQATSKERDLRFYKFKTDLFEYRKILNVLLNEVSGKMLGFSFGEDVSEYIDTSEVYNSGIHFYCDTGTSASETVSNSVSESMINSMLKGVSSKAREIAFLTGTADRDSGDVARTFAQDEEDSNRTLLNTLANGITETTRTVSGVFGESGKSVVSAENIIFPKIWSDSGFEKSYNLSFKFVSPYGDAQSIFENVYVPFLMLFALALPRQVRPDSYKSPMLIRLDSPGFLSCDMGMITNFTFIRGGQNNLWSSSGLPLAIDVNCTVTDMYPTLAVASNMALLSQNIGLSAFLDNMCGLNMMRANVAANAASSLANKASIFSGVNDSVKTAGADVVEKILSSMTF
jgi:hypothetical protein